VQANGRLSETIGNGCGAQIIDKSGEDGLHTKKSAVINKWLHKASGEVAPAGPATRADWLGLAPCTPSSHGAPERA